MHVKALLSATAVALTLAFAGSAHAATGPYKTDAQAQRYLETRLTSWAGIDVSTVVRSAYCLNGYYSRHERRTGRHYGQRIDRNGEPRFRTFSCSFSFDDGTDYRTFELYVQTRTAGPWYVSADR